MRIEESIPKKIFLPLDTFCFICHTSFYYNDCTLQIEGRGVITDFFFFLHKPSGQRISIQPGKHYKEGSHNTTSNRHVFSSLERLPPTHIYLYQA